MNLSVGEASLFVHKLVTALPQYDDVEVVLAPTMLALQPVSLQLPHNTFTLAAQNFYWRDQGAYTGEVSANQLRGLVKYALIGHSERRHLFGEYGRDIRYKVQAAYRNSIIPVLCVGETASERSVHETNEVLHDQIAEGLANVTSDEIKSLVIAYEPVWAISSGKDVATHAVPTPEEIEKAVKAIRTQVSNLFGATAARQVRVLYGGSVHADNVASFLDTKGVDGLLVGASSLDIRAFTVIIEKAHTVTTKGKKK